MSLSALPPELLCRISIYLGAYDLNALRLASRDSREKTRYDYEDRILSQRWRMSDDSLGTLNQLLQHPRFATRYTDLRISTSFLSEHLEREATGGGFDLWLEYLDEQHAFLKSSRPAALLTAVLVRMPGLRNVEIGQWCEPEEPFELGWGGNLLECMTESRLDPYMNVDPDAEVFDEDLDMIDMMDIPNMYNTNLTFNFDTVLTALSISQQPIETLAAHLWSDCEGFADDLRGVEVTGLQPFAQELGGASHLRTGLKNSLASLKQLQLVLEYRLADHEGFVIEHNEHWIQWLQEFIDLAPQLETLSLYFDGLAMEEQLGDTGNRIAFSCFARQAYMEHLTYLELANGVVASDSLYILLCKQWPKLKHMALKRVALDYIDPGKKDWSEILCGLGVLDDVPRSLSLACLYEEDGKLVTFSTEPSEECVCRSGTYHEPGIFRFPRCRHTMFETAEGRLPTKVQAVECPTMSSLEI
ncbi:hypothetical protein LTR08_007464 [Meristemomyces frigidus]|nr:hypothetical protein LTR08_007464 [Meristemomyces frigidus]